MNDKKQTAMQDLRQDLLDTIVTGSDYLDEIEDEQIRLAAKTLFKATIKPIIERIDDELLELEKQQIRDAWSDGYDLNNSLVNYTPEQYYTETFVK